MAPRDNRCVTPSNSGMKRSQTGLGAEVPQPSHAARHTVSMRPPDVCWACARLLPLRALALTCGCSKLASAQQDCESGGSCSGGGGEAGGQASQSGRRRASRTRAEEIGGVPDRETAVRGVADEHVRMDAHT